MSDKLLAKISYRAEVLLRVIDRNTTRDDNGALTSYWSPRDFLTEFPVEMGGKNFNTTISGAGDANCLRGLERKGLIRRERATNYSYSITEDGRVLIEQLDDIQRGKERVE